MIKGKSLLIIFVVAIVLSSLGGLQLLYAGGGEKPRHQGHRKHKMVKVIGVITEVNDQGLILKNDNKTITAICTGLWIVQMNKSRKHMKWSEIAKLIDVRDNVTVVGIPLRGKIRALIIVDKDKEFRATSTMLLRRIRVRHIKPTRVKVKIEGTVGNKTRVGFILVQDTGRVLVFCIGRWKRDTGEVIPHIDLLKELETEDKVEIEGKILIIHHKGKVHIAIYAEKITDLTKGLSFTKVKD